MMIVILMIIKEITKTRYEWALNIVIKFLVYDRIYIKLELLFSWFDDECRDLATEMSEEKNGEERSTISTKSNEVTGSA